MNKLRRAGLASKYLLSTAGSVLFGDKPPKPPEKAFWGGYSSYFRDPDGHYWEVAHNPYFALDENGNLHLGAKT